MTEFENRGEEVRNITKELILSYMKSNIYCLPDGRGVKQAVIFRDCGLASDGNAKATVTNQQYWMIALLYELKEEGLIEFMCERGPWRLTNMAII